MTASPFIVERSNLILYCARWTETTAFYRETLRLPVEFANDWLVEFRINGTSFVSIADASRATIRSVKGQGLTLTFKVADVAVAREAILDDGAIVGPIVSRWGSPSFYLHDPEGHRLEFWAE